MAIRTVDVLPDLHDSLEARIGTAYAAPGNSCALVARRILQHGTPRSLRVIPSSAPIELRDANGTLGARIDVPVRWRAVTQLMRDARTALELGWLNVPGSVGLVDRAESERLAKEAPFADSLPYFRLCSE